MFNPTVNTVPTDDLAPLGAIHLQGNDSKNRARINMVPAALNSIVEHTGNACVPELF